MATRLWRHMPVPIATLSTKANANAALPDSETLLPLPDSLAQTLSGALPRGSTLKSTYADSAAMTSSAVRFDGTTFP